MTVTVYTKDFCPQCNRVKAALDKDGLEYEEAPIDERVLNLARIKGWKAAPIVVSDEHPNTHLAAHSPTKSRTLFSSIRRASE